MVDSSFFPMPVLHYYTLLPKRNIQTNDVDVDDDDNWVAFSDPFFSNKNFSCEEVHGSGNENDDDVVYPIQFDWFEYNKYKDEKSRYVQITKVSSELFECVQHEDVIVKTKNQVTIGPGQIVLWMNGHHMNNPKQAQEVIREWWKHEGDYDKLATDELIIVTCELNDVTLLRFPFLKLCIIRSHDYHNINSECEFSYVKTRGRIVSHNKVLYVSSINPKSLWNTHSLLRCGDIVLAGNGYAVSTKEALDISMKFVSYNIRIYHLYVIDFVELQRHIYQRCVKDSVNDNNYQYDVTFLEATCQFQFHDQKNREKDTMSSNSDNIQSEIQRKDQTISKYAPTNGPVIACSVVDVGLWEGRTVMSREESEIVVPIKAGLLNKPSKRVAYRKVIVPFAKRYHNIVSSVLQQIQKSLRQELKDNRDRAIVVDDNEQRDYHLRSPRFIDDIKEDSIETCCFCFGMCMYVIQCAESIMECLQCLACLGSCLGEVCRNC